MSDREATFCPQCGPDVDIDEEGCCLTCGATAVGSAVRDIASLQAVLDAVRADCERAKEVAGRMASVEASAATLVLADRILRVCDGEVKTPPHTQTNSFNAGARVPAVGGGRVVWHGPVRKRRDG